MSVLPTFGQAILQWHTFSFFLVEMHGTSSRLGTDSGTASVEKGIWYQIARVRHKLHLLQFISVLWSGFLWKVKKKHAEGKCIWLHCQWGLLKHSQTFGSTSNFWDLVWNIFHPHSMSWISVLFLLVPMTVINIRVESWSGVVWYFLLKKKVSEVVGFFLCVS